ncbi:MAG TPA: FAD-linked oxidase C-terminal domain-containing protein, partial [Ktedonobacteraceae bacterium]|nr:FAD-linked oxidase C-terminal domain-containing protein [Ktedonobacteraceae bacterium]
IVKNVAGFDLPKVFAGSYGTLGLLTDITLKITPLPRARHTLLIPADDLRHGLIWARQMLPLALVTSAIVLFKGDTMPDVPGLPPSPYLLSYTAEGLPEDVEAELDTVRQLLHTAGAPPPLAVETPTGNDLWADLLRGAPRQALQARIGVPIRDLPAYIQDQSHLLHGGTFLADIANGLTYAVKMVDNAEEARAWLEALRQPALAAEGYAIAMNVPTLLQGAIDQWGYRPQALDVMQGLKARWDPAGILNPGVFVV